MNRTELLIWAAAAVVVNMIFLFVFGASWQPVVLGSVLIIILFLLRQAFVAGVPRDYGKELKERFGLVETSLFGLEWLERISDKYGKQCSMYVFPRYVVFVTPDLSDRDQVHILELDLNNIEQVRLSREGHININVTDGNETRRLFLKSSLPYDKIVRSMETLQAEIIHERKAQALQKVSAKARQLNEQLRKSLEERRRVRIEKLHNEGRELVKRFAVIVPEEIFIKDSLFEKCKELLKFEFRGRKSPLPGRLEGFLDNDFKPFCQIMREKAGFDFEDDEDLIILLNAIREEVRESILASFLAQFSAAFDRIFGIEQHDFDKYLDVFIRLCGTGVKDLKNLEGLRLFLQKQGYEDTLKDLESKIDSYLVKLEQEKKKHGLEKKINSGRPVFDDIGDVDILGEVEFAEFIKMLVTQPGDDVEDIIFLDDSRIELVFNAGQMVVIHAVKTALGIDAGDIANLAQVRVSRGAEVGLFITTSFLTDRAVEMAEQKGIIVWDRIRLQDEIKESDAIRNQVSQYYRGYLDV